MTAIEQFWNWFEQTGACAGNPQPRLAPNVERALQEELDEEVAQGGKEPDTLPELPRVVRLAQRRQARCVLYPVESLLDDGLWGPGVAEIGELLNQPLPWALVLLERGALRGYWLTNAQVKEQSPHWERLVPDGPHYKLALPDDIGAATPFHSENELKLLLEQLWAKP